jgi:hypothetical protein
VAQTGLEHVGKVRGRNRALHNLADRSGRRLEVETLDVVNPETIAARRQRLAARRFDGRCHGVKSQQAANAVTMPNGALGVVFVGLGIAEIGEHAVAHILGDETAVALDQIRAAAMVSAAYWWPG